MSTSVVDILQTAIPGEEILLAQQPRAWKKLPEQPWKYWRAGTYQFAVYVIAGNHISRTTLEAVDVASALGLMPVFLAPTSEALSQTAPHFGQKTFAVACEIAGKGALIRFPGGVHSTIGPQTTPPSRVPFELLDDLVAIPDCPEYLRRCLQKLLTTFRQQEDTWSDDNEHAALSDCAITLLRRLGFRSPSFRPQEALRKLESAGWGGRRDHFFHSFQNYFLGLYAVMRLSQYFNAYQTLARLHFNIDPFQVWFLTALWHDVGYGIEKLDSVFEEMLGDIGTGADLSSHARTEFLRAPIVQEGLRAISSLLARLLKFGNATTAWLPPSPRSRRSALEKQVEDALEANVANGSHGAASSLQLYAKYMPAIRRMGPANQQLMEQTVLVACCSAPFHDYHFRDCVREKCGNCEIPTEAMPFAGLLAFVDSIQDDRRDLRGLQHELRFLERLLVEEPARVSAQVNRGAVPITSLLWKLVEAKHVLTSLQQRTDHLFFQYPDWMVA